jgi:sec-independent protein translocase protein TatA
MIGHLQSLAFFSAPGTGEWMVILLIGLLVFGRRLPEVARNLGKSVNEFKRGLRDFQDSADEVIQDVAKIKEDVVTQAKDAAGLDDLHSLDVREPAPGVTLQGSSVEDAQSPSKQDGLDAPAGPTP